MLKTLPKSRTPNRIDNKKVLRKRLRKTTSAIKATITDCGLDKTVRARSHRPLPLNQD
jgi:hypothetical protein